MICVLIGAFAAHVIVNGLATPVGICNYVCEDDRFVQRLTPYGSMCTPVIKMTLANVGPQDDPLSGGSPRSSNVFPLRSSLKGRPTNERFGTVGKHLTRQP